MLLYLLLFHHQSNLQPNAINDLPCMHFELLLALDFFVFVLVYNSVLFYITLIFEQWLTHLTPLNRLSVRLFVCLSVRPPESPLGPKGSSDIRRSYKEVPRRGAQLSRILNLLKEYKNVNFLIHSI